MSQPGEKVVLKLEGKLLEPWLDELRGACDVPEQSEGLHLDLSGLHFADSSGVTLLRSLAGQGAALSGCSPFIAGLLEIPGDSQPRRDLSGAG
jgi:hypothetical protein